MGKTWDSYSPKRIAHLIVISHVFSGGAMRISQYSLLYEGEIASFPHTVWR